MDQKAIKLSYIYCTKNVKDQQYNPQVFINALNIYHIYVCVYVVPTFFVILFKVGEMSQNFNSNKLRSIAL